MANFMSTKTRETAEEYRHFWNINELLPKDVNAVHKNFELQELQWNFWAFYLCDMLSFHISSSNRKDDHLNRLFDINIGLCTDDFHEIAIQKTEFRKYSGSKFTVDNLCHRSKVESFMFIFVEISRKDNIQKIKISTDLKDLLLSGENSDLIIKVERRLFNVHKKILKERSPGLLDAVECFWKEKSNSVVTITDTDSATFEELLMYIYSLKKENLTIRNIKNIYLLAEKYALEDLKELCVDFMMENISVENFCDYYHFAYIHSSYLTNVIMDFFIKKSAAIVRSKNWIDYLRSNPLECNMLIIVLADMKW